MKAIKVNETANDRVVYTTNDLSKFKAMPGNRTVTKMHVKELINLILQNGNLTFEFPIVVTSDMFVIDGQHRLEALRQLGYEIAYVVQENATIDTVRQINQGARNWSWRDVATSYAELGNKEYEWFLSFVDNFHLRFETAMAITGVRSARNAGRSNVFNSGNLVIKDRAKSVEIAKCHEQILEAVGEDRFVSVFSTAAVNIVKSPHYNHDRMIAKLKQRGDLLPNRANRMDYMRLLEETYNFGYPEESRVRLF